jgi:hypothetical protein
MIRGRQVDVLLYALTRAAWQRSRHEQAVRSERS